MIRLSLPDRKFRVECPAFAPDGRQLASADDSGRVAWWAVGSGSVWLMPETDFIDRVTVSPDGGRVFAVGHQGLRAVATANGAS